jgi:hypothetical protein
MRNIHDVLREKETKVQKLALEVKVLRWAVRLLENGSPSPPGRAAEPRSPRATTAMINFEDGTVLPMSEDVSQTVHWLCKTAGISR